jgi:hypothetical protein
MDNTCDDLPCVYWEPATIVLSDGIRMIYRNVIRVIVNDEILPEFEHPESNAIGEKIIQVDGEYGWGIFPTKDSISVVYVKFACSHHAFEGMPGPSVIIDIHGSIVPHNEGDEDTNKDEDPNGCYAFLFDKINRVVATKFEEMKNTA